MAGTIAFLKEHRLFWAVVVSMLLHLLILLFTARQGNLLMIRLPESGESSAEKRIAFELVETPEDARSAEAPEDARLASDKNAVARDMQTEDPARSDLPYSDGDVGIKNISRGSSPANNAPASYTSQGAAGESEPAGDGSDYRVQSYADGARFSRDLLLGQNAVRQKGSNEPRYDQKEGGAEDVGGISFNTYAWDFAPYLLELKRRIQRNIYPPPAFTQLGFGGNNIVRFCIYPDGRLVNLEVLDYKGEKALVETSSKAVEFSAPFPPLPEDFPEAFLQVTAKFDYFIMGRY